MARRNCASRVPYSRSTFRSTFSSPVVRLTATNTASKVSAIAATSIDISLFFWIRIEAVQRERRFLTPGRAARSGQGRGAAAAGRGGL